jgi:glycine oxidase
VAGLRVIVIGAGAIGLFAGLALARAGAQVTVIEADSAMVRLGGPPRAASAAAAGMLGPFSEVLHETPGAHRRLKDLAASGLQAWRAFADSDVLIKRFVRFDGALLLGHDDADGARVRRAYDRARQYGVDAEWFDGLPPDLDPIVFGARVKGAARIPGEGVVAPLETLARLEEMLVAEGGSVLRDLHVVHLETSGGFVRAVRFEEGGEMLADRVVLCPGALAPASLARAAPALLRVTPAKGLLGLTEPLSAPNLPEVIRTPRVCAVKDAFGQYRFGSITQPGCTDLDEDDDALGMLYLELRRALPGQKFAPAKHFSVGLRPLSPDHAPIIGPSGPDGCFVACGHGRNGWLLAPLTGAMIAAFVLGQELPALWAEFTPERFSP